MKTLIIMFSISSLFLLAACSSHHDRPKPIEHFSTQISDEGTKFFVYSLGIPSNRKNGKGSGRGMKRGNKEGQSRNKNESQANSKLDNRLTALLTENQYCRDGYFELERRQLMSGLSIRGECRESATEQDRQRFHN